MTAPQALYGLCHLYLDAVGPLAAVEIERVLREDDGLEDLVKNHKHEQMLERAPLSQIRRTLRRMQREGVVIAVLEAGQPARYRLRRRP